MAPRMIDVRTAQRSLVASFEITTLAAGAHVLAGGELPAPGFLLALGAVVLICSLATFGRLVRVATVVPVVLGAQVGLHAAFSSTEPMRGMASGQMNGSTGFLHLEPAMFWAHLVTSVVTAIVLLAQEGVLAAVASWLRPLTLVLMTPARRRARVVIVPARGSRRSLLTTSPRRGPPVLLAQHA